MRNWSTTNPTGPILTRFVSYFASTCKPEVWEGAITFSLTNEKVLIKTTPPSRDPGVLITDLAEIHFLI